MTSVTRAVNRYNKWADKIRRVVAVSQASSVLGAVLAMVAVVEAIVRAAVIGVSAQLVVALCLLALATTVPLVFLRPPAAALAVVLSSVLSITVFDTMTVAGLAAALIALYGLGRNDEPVLGVALALPFLALALAGPRPASSEVGSLTALLASLGLATVWAGAARAARTDARQQHAAAHAVAGNLLEHTARSERARIARELHDVVAHHISMVVVQAETTRLTTPGMPASGARRLSAIGDSARTALSDMRRLLGVLREVTQTDGADRRPQPGIPQLNELLDETRDATGTGIRLILRGPPRTLDPSVELAAYRIAQEALTNARRHAPGAAVDVELHYGDNAVRLRIRDNGPGPLPRPPSNGHGWVGMRERVAAAGGQLHVGVAAGGGFLVEATLPAQADGPRRRALRYASSSRTTNKSSAKGSRRCSTRKTTTPSWAPRPTAPKR
jgi:signal transduction histidine kinase